MLLPAPCMHLVKVVEQTPPPQRCEARYAHTHIDGTHPRRAVVVRVLFRPRGVTLRALQRHMPTESDTAHGPAAGSSLMRAARRRVAGAVKIERAHDATDHVELSAKVAPVS